MTRKFFLGSEWLYYKIYSGVNVLDKLLCNEIFEVVSFLYDRRLIDKFFFIRYTDNGGQHLRLRFHLCELSSINKIITLFHQKFTVLIENRYIKTITTDVYNREIERYGEATIEIVEDIFSLNSYKIIHYLRNEKKGLQIIPIINVILDAFDFSNDRKHLVCEEMYQNFITRSPDDLYLKRHIQTVQREYMKEAEQTLYIECNLPGFDEQLYMRTLKNNISKIDRSILIGSGKPTVEDVVKSIIHMEFNRFFSHNQNTYEVVIYYLLSKLYKKNALMEKKTLI
ncbi:thiopeptide-type bacteriocin biosynthesis protein [Pedobacter sp. 22163]|uniref:thiopeptide-type bacteriocin biosynthesis protein n=1 Tax=Pedobacter sp. 22163 TaxID=3453883 RepID=UPI003F84A4B6